MKLNEKQGKTGRIDLRTTELQRALLEAASEAEGASLSEFILRAATRAAEETLAERQMSLLPQPDWEAFMERLNEPPRDLPDLRKFLERPTVFTQD
jgi:uncharacterized protein (DUF1778 family)